MARAAFLPRGESRSQRQPSWKRLVRPRAWLASCLSLSLRAAGALSRWSVGPWDDLCQSLVAGLPGTCLCVPHLRRPLAGLVFQLAPAPGTRCPGSGMLGVGNHTAGSPRRIPCAGPQPSCWVLVPPLRCSDPVLIQPRLGALQQTDPAAGALPGCLIASSSLCLPVCLSAPLQGSNPTSADSFSAMCQAWVVFF